MYDLKASRECGPGCHCLGCRNLARQELPSTSQETEESAALEAEELQTEEAVRHLLQQTYVCYGEIEETDLQPPDSHIEIDEQETAIWQWPIQENQEGDMPQI